MTATAPRSATRATNAIAASIRSGGRPKATLVPALARAIESLRGLRLLVVLRCLVAKHDL